jgi:hypothetical protein
MNIPSHLMIPISITSLLVGSYVLNLTTEWFNVPKPKYKIALIISISLWAVNLIIRVGGQLILFNTGNFIFYFLFLLVTSLTIFHILLSYYYKTILGKSISIFFVSAIVQILVLFVLFMPLVTYLDRSIIFE